MPLFVSLIALLFASLASNAAATEVRVMISAGFFNVYSELGPKFEAATGHKLITTRGPSVGDSSEAIPTRLARGEIADLVIMEGAGADMLEKRDLIQAGSQTPLAESFIGVVVRAGQPKPDISTVEALRKTLLAAKSIAVSDSSSGTYLLTTGFAKLGLADQLADKTRKVRGPPSGEPVAAVVARGEAEIGFQQVAEMLHVEGAEVVGTVPTEIQPPTLYVGALTKTAEQKEAASLLLHFLSSAAAADVIANSGLKPLTAR